MANYIVSSGEVSSGIILEYNSMTVLDGGVASAITVNSGGWMDVDSGCTATNIVASKGARLTLSVAPDTFIQGTSDGSAFEMKDGVISAYVIDSGNRLNVESGGTANGTTVNSGGYLYVSSGGTANNTMVNSEGHLSIFSGGTENTTTVNSGGWLDVNSGGTAIEILENGGYVYVMDGANVTFASNTISGLVLSTYATVHSGTTANSTTVNCGGRLEVSSGASVNSTTVNSGGWLYASSGASVNSTTVNSGGRLYVSSGASVNSTTVNSSGWLYVSSGGMANSTTVNSRGSLGVSSGGTANNTTINSGGIMGVDGTANRTTVLSSGSLFVHLKGTANSVTVNSGGRLFVSSGGTATNFVASKGARLELQVAPDTFVHGTYDGNAFEMKDEIISGYEVYSGITLNVISGGTANSTTIILWGSMRISGGTANDTIIDYGGNMDVLSGGIVNSTTVGGSLDVYSGGTAYDTTINEKGSMDVNYDGIANNTMVNSGGSMGFYSGGTANRTTVLSSGSLSVERNGTANSVTVNSGGWMGVDSGCTATNIVASKGARLTLNVAPDTFIQGTSDGSAFEMKDGVISAYVIDSGNRLNVESGGTANSTTVNSGGWLYVSSGASVNSTTINFGGWMVFSSDYTANDTTINSGGTMVSYSGGTANDTTINSGGYMVYSRGTANRTTVLSGGRLSAGLKGIANSVTVNSGGWMGVDSGCTATNIVASKGASFYFGVTSDTFIQGTSDGSAFEMKDGAISAYAINSGIRLDVKSGCVAHSTTINGGAMGVHDGGSVNNTMLNSGSLMSVSSGGTANSTTVKYGIRDKEFIEGAFVWAGGIANDTMIAPEGRLVLLGGMANNTVVGSDGALSIEDLDVLIYSGGIANDTTVDNGGIFYVGGGGTANRTTVNSGGSIRVNATVKDIVVSSGGSIIVFPYYHNGKLTGQMTFASGAIVSNSGSLVLDFDLSGLTPTAEARVNDLSIVKDNHLIYTLTVSGLQADGTYVLAEGATGFNDTITVINGTTEKQLGTLTVGGLLSVGEGLFSLNLSDSGTLSLTLSGFGDSTAPTVSNIRATPEWQTYSSVVVTADFADDVDLDASLYRIGETGEWTEYSNNVTVSENTTVYFKAVDAAGNESEIRSCTVSNILPLPDNATAVDKVIIDSESVDSGQIYIRTVVSGAFEVCSGGTATDTTVLSSGYMTVFSSGSANRTTVLSSGYMDVWFGGTASHTMIVGGYMGVGGMADITTIKTGGSVDVGFNGMTNNVTVSSGGRMGVNTGGTANHTTVLSSGYMGVYSEGTANSVTVNSGGTIWVGGSGCTATNIVASKGARLTLIAAADTFIQWTSDGSAFEMKDGVISAYAINSGNSLYLKSGGTANGTTVNSGGIMDVYSGCNVNSTTVNSSGAMGIDSDGSANNTVINEMGAMTVYTDGIANNTTVNSGGKMEVFPGGTATGIVENGGYVDVRDGANVSFASNTISGLRLSYASATIHSGTIANDTMILVCAWIHVSSGGIVNNTEVLHSGCLLVDFGGFANSTYIGVNASCEISSGGVANRVTVDLGGSMYVSSGGTMTGQIEFDEEAEVEMFEGAVLDFDISEFAPGNDSARVSNLSVVRGTPIYTLTVSASQADGVYSLATGAANFNSTITVMNTNGESLGALVVGETVTIYGDDYTLDLNNEGNLSLALNTLNEPVNPYPPVDPDDPPVSSGGKDILLAHIMPEAEYMYGCVPTAVGMLLGYYDLYGYKGYAFSNMIEGDVDLYSRGTDGNAYDMDAFDTVLGRAIASEEYVYRFVSREGVETTPEQELEYAFMPDNQTLNTDVWNCLADYLGTGQYWRGNENLATRITYGSLLELVSTNYYDEVITDGVNTRTVSYKDSAMLYGLDLYVQSRGYRLNDSATGTYLVKENGGSFTFAQYMKEIDAGRPVLIGIDSHAMVGYGYNADTQEIIFDDCNRSGQRMVWGGTYNYSGKEREIQAITVIALDESSGEKSPDVPIQENLVGTTEQITWEATGAEQYIVEYSTDNFEHVLKMVTTGNGIDTPDLPAGNYQWRVKEADLDEWAVGNEIWSEADSSTPKFVLSNINGQSDLFFATANGTWELGYYAQHVGSINDWTGTNEIVSANGKGRIQNLFYGLWDPNVLCLTDGENGDAIFVDDIYTELPDEIEMNTARLYLIREIRAGFGDDIVDMTSQRFMYIGDGLTIRGGAGNDTIWANKGNNMLFGDAGNDRIVGASGNDVIAGGIGNDRMHGGGGDDVFTFCDNWGVDNVEQLATGSVTLWFASGDESNWNADTMTYTDGDNSVKVTGVSEVTLKFGDDTTEQYATLAQAGAFLDFTSECIFEESGKGVLASL